MTITNTAFFLSLSLSPPPPPPPPPSSRYYSKNFDVKALLPNLVTAKYRIQSDGVECSLSDAGFIQYVLNRIKLRQAMIRNKKIKSHIPPSKPKHTHKMINVGSNNLIREITLKANTQRKKNTCKMHCSYMLQNNEAQTFDRNYELL